MPLSLHALPLPTPYDRSEDPPGSIDPMGTLMYAERLAEVLLPGMTSRMWKARFLTFSAVAALIADRVVKLMDGREDVRLEARLAFERLYVSAVVRADLKNTQEWRNARRRLPGSDLARRALNVGEPLTRSNFLKGQAVNGPYGVLATLAKRLGIVDEYGHPSQQSTNLILAWSEDEGLPGVLDEEGTHDRAGRGWMLDATKAVHKVITRKDWPGPGQRIWDQLASGLRSDRIRKHERRVLVSLLEENQVRRRVFEILRDREATYRDAEGHRGDRERRVLLKAVRPALGNDPLDRSIKTVVGAIDAYETASSLVQQAFDAVIWGLKQRGGRATLDAVLSDPRVARQLGATAAAVPRCIGAVEESLLALSGDPVLNDPLYVEPLATIREEIMDTAKSGRKLVEAVMRRHESVQRDKRKGAWIDDLESQWTLLPGFGIDGDSPPRYEGRYLHPFRILNAYALMGGIGQVTERILDAEA